MRKKCHRRRRRREATGMTFAATQALEFMITVGGVFALLIGFVFGLLWIWNR